MGDDIVGATALVTAETAIPPRQTAATGLGADTGALALALALLLPATSSELRAAAGAGALGTAALGLTPPLGLLGACLERGDEIACCARCNASSVEHPSSIARR